MAVATNRAHEAATPPTFVDDAELVWKLVETGKRQETIAAIMGWKAQSMVSQYYALRKIIPEGWKLIITAFRNEVESQENGHVIGTISRVINPFSEGILREIVNLTHPQQLELIKALIKDPTAKGAYRNQAERYRARNALIDEAGSSGAGLLAPRLSNRAWQECERPCEPEARHRRRRNPQVRLVVSIGPGRLVLLRGLDRATRRLHPVQLFQRGRVVSLDSRASSAPSPHGGRRPAPRVHAAGSRP